MSKYVVKITLPYRYHELLISILGESGVPSMGIEAQRDGGRYHCWVRAPKETLREILHQLTEDALTYGLTYTVSEGGALE